VIDEGGANRYDELQLDIYFSGKIRFRNLVRFLDSLFALKTMNLYVRNIYIRRAEYIESKRIGALNVTDWKNYRKEDIITNALTQGLTEMLGEVNGYDTHPYQIVMEQDEKIHDYVMPYVIHWATDCTMSSNRLHRLNDVDDNVFDSLVTSIILYNCDQDINALCQYIIGDAEHEEETKSNNYQLTTDKPEEIKKICLSAKRQVESSSKRTYYSFSNITEYGIIAICDDTALVCGRDVIVALKYSFYTYANDTSQMIEKCIAALVKEIKKK
jgi:hypothetical protein